jgi:hypothetical protein
MQTDGEMLRRKLADELERLLDRRANREGVPGARVHDRLTHFVESNRAAILAALRAQPAASVAGESGEAVARRNVYRLQMNGVGLCQALRRIADGEAGPQSIARNALEHRPAEPDWNCIATLEPQAPAANCGEVERVARAICEADCGGPLGYFPDGTPMRDSSWDDFDERQQEAFKNTARAAIAALSLAPRQADEAERENADAKAGEGEWEATLRYCEREWAAERGTMLDRIAALEARLAKAVEALEPFAGIADTLDEVGRTYEDDDRVNVVQAAGCQLAELTEDHFRRARAAIQEGPSHE